MPAVVKSTVGSFSGIRDLPEISACPRALKKSRYFRRSSLPVMGATIGGRRAESQPARQARIGSGSLDAGTFAARTRPAVLTRLGRL